MELYKQYGKIWNRAKATKSNYFNIIICHEDYSFFALFLASISGTVFLPTNSTYMYTCMQIYIHTQRHKWCEHISSSEQGLITETCQGLGHGQTRGRGWVHAYNLMLLTSCGSHAQSLKHATGGVKWGMWKTNSAFKQNSAQEQGERWTECDTIMGCPKTSSGLAMALICLWCLINVVPELLTLLVLFGCSSSCGCPSIWPPL